LKFNRAKNMLRATNGLQSIQKEQFAEIIAILFFV